MNWTPEEYDRHIRKANSVATPSKYRNVKMVVDGHTFDSKAEAQRYHELRLMQKAGLIHKLQCQPSYSLKVNGVRLGMYFADFAYYDCAEMEIVEDVKGMKTLPLAKWKQKHLKAQYGITVREIR